MQSALTVTTLNHQIKSLLETHYLQVTVIGEVSRATYHSSGHLYFTLKDDNSAISCVMFKGNNQKLKFQVEDGMEVIVTGGVTVYTPRGTYQINCTNIEPSGSGALAIAFEQLKRKLQEKGYFDPNRKKAIPTFPNTIAIITSKTGAAIEDMKRVAAKRWPLAKFILIDTLVQGDQAADMIANHIAYADKLGVDVIVIGRGGGSIEDLWAFNEEVIADAIFEAKTPIVSAVGHEIDHTISDFCADLRAPTPSAAMEMILPDIFEITMTIDTLREQFDERFLRVISHKEQQLLHTKELFLTYSYRSKLERLAEKIDTLKEQFRSYKALVLSKKEESIRHLKELYERNNPAFNVKIGYVQISKDNQVRSLEDIKVGDEVELSDAKEIAKVKILSKKAIF